MKTFQVHGLISKQQQNVSPIVTSLGHKEKGVMVQYSSKYLFFWPLPHADPLHILEWSGGDMSTVILTSRIPLWHQGQMGLKHSGRKIGFAGLGQPKCAEVDIYSSFVRVWHEKVPDQTYISMP